MKMMRGLYLFVVLGVLMGAGVFFTPPAAAQTLHALLVIMDDDPTIGDSVVIDQKRVSNLLLQLQNQGVCSVKKKVLLSSQDLATTDQVKKWLREVRPGSNDVVFVYYSGHGAMIENMETFIALQGGSLLRKDLVETMARARDCRLKILITDACSSAVRVPVEDAFANPTLKSTLRNLFIEHKGFLHLTAATEGEYAWGDTRRGGWFTNPLVKTILEEWPDPNGDNFVSWKDVFESAKKKTMQFFAESEPRFSAELKADLRARGITSQTPKYYSLPTRTSGIVRDDIIRSPRGD